MSRSKQHHEQYTQLIKDAFAGDTRVTNVLVGLNDDTRLFLSFRTPTIDLNACWQYVKLQMPPRTKIVKLSFSPPDTGSEMWASFLVEFDVTP